MYFVYLIKSVKNNSFYIGCTEDIKRRLKEHNQGKTKSIKYKIPYKLIYCEIYPNKTIARKREIELKNNSFKKKELIGRLNLLHTNNLSDVKRYPPDSLRLG